MRRLGQPVRINLLPIAHIVADEVAAAAGVIHLRVLDAGRRDALLAQRLDGGPGVQAAWPRDLGTLSRSQMIELQTALNQQGFASGAPDGAGQTPCDGWEPGSRNVLVSSTGRRNTF